ARRILVTVWQFVKNLSTARRSMVKAPSRCGDGLLAHDDLADPLAAGVEQRPLRELGHVGTEPAEERRKRRSVRAACALLGLESEDQTAGPCREAEPRGAPRRDPAGPRAHQQVAGPIGAADEIRTCSDRGRDPCAS